MYEELIKVLRNNADHYMTVDGEAGLVYLLTDAADAIEKLSKSKWIPVTERLPNEKVWVLVFIHEENKAFVAVSMRIDFNYWSGLGRDHNITHWMPLPEPPKEEG